MATCPDCIANQQTTSNSILLQAPTITGFLAARILETPLSLHSTDPEDAVCSQVQQCGCKKPLSEYIKHYFGVD